MKILVTGAAGYIGSHFVKKALDRYPTVKICAVDDLREGHNQAVPDSERVSFHNLAMDNEAALDPVLAREKPVAVVHFAANAYVGESQEKPFKYFDNNVTGSLKLFKLLAKYGVNKVIFSSSCTTYGNPQYVPIDENHPQNPINVYGTTKLMIEKALHGLHLASGWSYVSLRYFNAAGADDQGAIGESHDPETHLIPLVLQAAIGRREEISIYGNDYDTEDGTCIRDYVHVYDLAEAHCLALDKLLALKEGESTFDAINLGTSKGASVEEVIKTCEKVSGRSIKRKVTERRAGDPAKLVADYTRAKEILGWEPKYDLERIIETAWTWESSRQY